MGMIEKGVPEICLFQSNGIKTFLWHASSNMQIEKSTVYKGCSINSRPKVEADILYSFNLVRVQIYSIDEYTASLKL